MTTASIYRALLAALTSLLCSGTAWAFTAGEIDTSFDPGSGANNYVYTSVLQADGKIIIGGHFTTINGTTRNRIARLNTDGSLDSSFDPGSGVSSGFMAIAVQTDGKIIVGSFNYIARLNADGSLDSSFNPGSGVNNYVRTSVLQADGKIIIGGDFTTVNGTARNRIARLNTDGSLDSSFNPGSGASGSVYTSALQADGKIIIGGLFATVNGTARSDIARLNADGSLDLSFNPIGGANANVYTSAIQPDGKIIIGGSFGRVNGTILNRVARLNADGSLDQSFDPGSGANGSIYTSAIQADGKIIIGGDFTTINGAARNTIARLNTDGALDQSFDSGSGASGGSRAVAVQADGKIIIGGDFTTINAVTLNYIARLYSGDSDSDGIEDAADQLPLNPDESVDTDHDGIGNNADVDDDNDTVLDASDNCPLLGNAGQVDGDGDGVGDSCDNDNDNDGMFDIYDAFPLNAAVSLDTDRDGIPTAWNATCDTTCQVNSGLVLDNCPLNTNADQLDNDSDAQGDVCDTDDDNDTVLDSVDNCPLLINVDQLDSDSDTQGDVCDSAPLLALAGALDANFNPGSGANNYVFTSALQPDGKIIIGGDFATINGTTRNRIARLNVDGSLDQSFNSGSGAGGSIYASALQTDGKIIIGGLFTAVNGTTRNNIARLNADGSLDQSFNPGGANNTVWSTAVQVDGKIIISGLFTTVNGTVRNRIARLNTDGSLDQGFNPGSGANNSVYASVIQADGKIIIGGSFSTVNGTARNFIARLNADGSLDQSFNPGSAASSSVRVITVQGDGKIIIGGFYPTVNGTSRNYIARLNANGSLDSSFNPGSEANSYIFAIVLQLDGKIIVGGDFTTINGTVRNCIARLDADGSLDASFNSDANASVRAVAVQAAGQIIIGGNFTTINGAARNRIARLHSGDSDADGIEDAADQLPFNPDESVDTDRDGIGNNADGDDDNDAVPDAGDNCPLLINAGQVDIDGDGVGDSCDNDNDNDGTFDIYDAFPLNAAVSLDTDRDGIPTAWNAACDASCQVNSGLVLDNCPLNANADQLNSDGDAQGDVCDTDDDNDTVLDTVDNCPQLGNVNQQDSDSDTQGDVCDPGPFLAPAGALDASFHPSSGADGFVYTSAVQADGKIIIGGSFATINGVGRRSIARLNTDGSLDSSFNPSGGANSSVYTSALQADGKIIIGGIFTTVNSTTRNRIARLNINGSLDASFNPSNGANNDVGTVTLQADGKMIVGGSFTAISGTSRSGIARLNANGSLDSSFNPGSGTNSSVTVSAVQADGKIIIGGLFNTVNGTARNYIARLNANGSLDTSFNPGSGANYHVYAIALQTDGKIIIGGDFTAINGTARNSIARLNVDGSLDLNFNPGSGASAGIRAVAVQGDGKIIIGGLFATVNGTARNYIARLNANGSLDTSFNQSNGVNNSIYTSTIQANGKIIIGGNFTTINGVKRGSVARIHSGDADNDGIADDIDYDDDNDGMSDAWEVQYGFNPLVNDANGDLDNDGLTNLQEYSNGSNPTIAVTVKNDYNNDNIAGWIWKGVGNGYETESQSWQLTFPLYSANWSVPTRFYHPTFPDQANWDIVTSGDFNKDGDADIVWRNNVTDAWKIWQMQNGLRVAQTNWTDAFDPTRAWTVVGAGDTDKDGDDDIILNNTSTGEVLIWEMQNHAVVATHNVGTKAGYTLNRIGDFNKDGDIDLLFRQNGGDALITWEIETNAFVAERALANTGTDFSPVCAGDFDKDGDDDIMLVNSTTQQEKWFVMENYTRTQQFGGTNDGFVFLGCGDYDGDGDADSLWQRSADDMNRVVLQQNWGETKQTVYTNAFGGVNPGAAGYGFVYRGNNN